MASYAILTTFTDTDFSYSTSLSNIAVNLRFTYNYRTEHYHLTATLRDGTELVSGQKLCVGAAISNAVMFDKGLTGIFRLVPLTDDVEDNATTRKDMPANYILSYTDY